MHPPGLRVDRRLQRFGIGRAQFGELAPFEHLAGHLDPLPGQPFENADVGGILPALALLAALQPHLVEQDIAELLGAADGEGLAGEVMDFAFQPRGLMREFGGEARQLLAVDLDAVALHLRHHRHKRAVHALVDARAAFVGQAGLEHAVQPPGDIGVLGGIGGGAVERHFGEADRLLARAADVLEGDAAVAEVA